MKLDHAYRRTPRLWRAVPLAAVLTALFGAGLLLGDEPAGDSKESEKAEIKSLIGKAVEARDSAVQAVPRARGKGSYKVVFVDSDMHVREQRAAFRMARSGPLEFIQFRYERGAGPDHDRVYARVVLSNGDRLYESQFYRRIGEGADGTVTESFNKVSLQPVVWISGNLADYYSFIDKLPSDKFELSLRDKDGLKVLKADSRKDKAAYEFWIDPRQGFQIVRFRLLVYVGKTTIVPLDVTRQWKQTDGLWHVSRCVCRQKTRDKEEKISSSTLTELTFETFEPNVEIPKELFTVDALGLPAGTLIMPDGPGAPERYQPDPKLDVSKVEKVVGELPP